MSKQTDAAERKGREAFLQGKTELNCPYVDYRTSRGSITFSRTFIVAWLRGYNKAKQEAAMLPSPAAATGEGNR